MWYTALTHHSCALVHRMEPLHNEGHKRHRRLKCTAFKTVRITQSHPHTYANTDFAMYELLGGVLLVFVGSALSLTHGMVLRRYLRLSLVSSLVSAVAAVAKVAAVAEVAVILAFMSRSQ